MKWALAVLVALVLLSSVPAKAQPAEVSYRIRVVFVEPSGETFTADEQAYALQSVRDGAEWWHELSPITTTLTVEATGFVTTAADVWSDPNELTRSTGYTPEDGTVLAFVVDNTASGKRWQGNRAVGLAYYDPHVIWLLVYSGPDVAAHELGHTLYNLDDLPGNDLDIMKFMSWMAYEKRFIGCDSLAALGHPCSKTYLPVVGR